MLMDKLYETTTIYSKAVTKSKRKSIGQFFTPPSIAEYMSKLMYTQQKKIRVLDTGAGTGMLGGAICKEAFNNDQINEIHVDFYELDSNVIPYLKQNIEFIQTEASEKGKMFTFNIVQENFIMHNELVWQDNFAITEEDKYDVVIGNPPYKKIGKSTEESSVMSSVVHGQPNIYFLFMAMATALLKDRGEIIYIVPRSFTSGLYFKKFREYFLNTVKLTHLHLFHSRSDVFNSDKVLQEAIIFRAIKTNQVPEAIEVSSSENLIIRNSITHKVPYNTIVDMNSSNLFILIPASSEEIELLKVVHSWKHNLLQLGFQLKTGPVVDFRAKDLLHEEPSDSTVPLLWSNHIKDHKITFPTMQSKNPQYINDSHDSKKVLLPNRNYIIIKRFTSKEEKRRVQSALYFKEDYKNLNVGIENHLNYITKLGNQMTKEEMYGLFALFNSSYIDSYYRILNGSTQVNATEINAIPLPSIDEIIKMGNILMELDSLSTDACDKLIKEIISTKIERTGEINIVV
jgi:adenine-specific DNA-methyltransferase